jgi:hypothetical protein
MKKKSVTKTKTALVKATPSMPIETSFAEVVGLIEQARKRTYQAVNAM